MFPQFLREAGYYCTNNSKEDYNLAETGPGVGRVVASRPTGGSASRGQPFFAVFNSAKSHESQIRKRPHTPVHDPAKVRVPAYHPDTPEVRQDWAQYYDKSHEADADAGAIAARSWKRPAWPTTRSSSIYADHGSRHAAQQALAVQLRPARAAGRLRSRRSSGISPPTDYTPGGKSDRLVSFVDFAPTVLEPGRHRAARVDAGPRLSRQASKRRRSRSSMASAAGWTSATTWSAR